MIESVAGEMIAAPSPCTARDAIRTPIELERPQASDATAKSPMPIMNMRLPPEQVAGAPAEQEEAAEGDRVGGDDPLQVLLRDS